MLALMTKASTVDFDPGLVLVNNELPHFPKHKDGFVFNCHFVGVFHHIGVTPVLSPFPHIFCGCLFSYDGFGSYFSSYTSNTLTEDVT